tara:strand:- start:94 stop:411 length:318 start_codon:yes stop_codon:yes gene_type:complete
VSQDTIVFDDFASDEMLLNDAFKHWRGASGVPDPFGIDHCNWTIHTNAQAVGFGSEDAALFGESKFFESGFKVVPCFKAQLFITALGFGLIAAKQDVPARVIDPQ